MSNKLIQFILWLLLFSECTQCNSQTPNTSNNQINDSKDSVATKFKPTQIPTSLVGYSEDTDPKHPEGYVLKDKNGKTIKLIKTDYFFHKNPYNDANFGSTSSKDIASFMSFDVKKLSIEKIKKGLPKALKKFPSNKILEKAGTIILTSSLNLNIENPNYIIIIYTIAIYGKETSVEDWSETTIHIYDNQGNICSNITDNRNIQGVFLSSDGRYLLANQILGRTGDGWSDVDLTTLVYDLKSNECIGSTRKSVANMTKNVLYQSGKFLAFGAVYEKFDALEENSLIKIIIDPINKKYYQKAHEKPNNISRSDEPALRLKTSQNESGEDIATYREFNL